MRLGCTLTVAQYNSSSQARQGAQLQCMVQLARRVYSNMSPFRPGSEVAAKRSAHCWGSAKVLSKGTCIHVPDRTAKAGLLSCWQRLFDFLLILVQSTICC